MSARIWPGKPFPLGATFDGHGVNFAVFSEIAERVDVCLFRDDGAEVRIPLSERTALCWHGYVPGARPGLRYGFRVVGPWNPNDGLRCNESKLLLDPYARSIVGDVTYDPAVFGHIIAPNGDATTDPNLEDSAPFVPRSVVVDPSYDWAGDSAPRHPMHRSILYEVHVKGFTALRHELPPEIRGTYAGLGHPTTVRYLQTLGITAVELLPVHHFVHDGVLKGRGLRNYWGYNSIGFFAPHAEYASRQGGGCAVAEFRQMVTAFHRAGIEVILDVVYNHTAEGNHLGPTLSFRGVDNRAYYRLQSDSPLYYTDYTGTGNSLNTRHPFALQLIMDSLRYWVTEMHVDGFRFDLASTLGRTVHDVDKQSPFFDAIHQDPVLSRVKLIAEPWDVGDGGYQVGNFPPVWSEWNGRYRDTVRDYWRGTDGAVAGLASVFAGSADLYARDRRPDASINFITAHDGFTLRDLVSYNEKHNDANGDNNTDGESHNRSWNCGAEGPTNNRRVNALRAKQQRNFLTTLLLSQGVPMILAGDEWGRSQGGNNNPYCQDNEISWFNWGAVDHDLLEFTRVLVRLRKLHPTFSRRHWLVGRPVNGGAAPDVSWLTPEGTAMTPEDWADGSRRSLMVVLNGCEIGGLGPRGEHIVDESFVFLFNAHHRSVEFTLTGSTPGVPWRVRVDSRKKRLGSARRHFRMGDRLRVSARSVLVLSNGAGASR